MKDDTVEGFLISLGDKSPTPGGGAVSALNGAIAAAQLKMVCEYTKDEKVNQQAGLLAQKVEVFIALSEADSNAFKQVSEAYKTKDSSRIDSSLMSAMKPSVDIVANCEELILFCEQNYEQMNKNLSADLVVVLANLRTAVQSSQAMEKINYESLSGDKPQNIKEHVEHCFELIGRIDSVLREIGALK